MTARYARSGGHHSCRNHQHRAEQSGCRSIQWQNLKLPTADEHVSDPEDHRRDEFLLEMIHTAANGSFARRGRNVIRTKQTLRVER
ncbi:MAG: hypothetical protein DME67_04185 [Verrucomicrobia bacterium]|nr:MAG: hypothetical protein DME95_08870 [Verrucomicrobiota bacterium]PYK05861.1 MAG: hypothetical protein DME67_04185 [Verrucomicrobiota bacterium]